MNRKKLFFLLLSLLLLFQTPASAQGENGEDAQDCYERGQRYYDLKKYTEAIKEFEKGYLLSELPAFLLNIAQAQRMLGDLAEAADYYRRFLDKTDTDDPAREGVEKILLEIEGPPKGRETRAPVSSPPRDTAPAKVVAPDGPVYDGGFTQEELQEILGEEYSGYLASGLTYEAYQRRKKARPYAWGGLGVAAVSFSTMLIVINIDTNSAEQNLAGLTTTFLIAGSIGATLGYYGFQAIQVSNRQRRPPTAASFALLPGKGAAASLSFTF